MPKSRLYMPFHSSAAQRMTGPIECHGACAFVELPASVFIPGGDSWDQVLELDEYGRMMQLFMFWLELLRSIDAYVVLETLVTNEFVDLHSSTLSNLVNVVGYRLWIVMPPDSAAVLNKQVSVTLAANTAEDVDVSETRSSKRRRVVEETHPDPIHHQPVATLTELIRLVRLYHGGRGAAIESMELYPGGGDSSSKTLVDYFDMQRQFSDKAYHDRAALNDLYKIQHDPTTYVRMSPSGDMCFYPTEPLRTTGLIRAFRLGPGGFLERSSYELYRYMLPQMAPSTAEIRAKLERVLSATGAYRSLRGKSREELIRTSESTDPNMFFDPHEFSAITADRRVSSSTDLASINIEDIARIYPTCQELHDRNAVRLKHLTKTKNVKGTHRFYSDLADSIHLLFSGPPIEGIPAVYGELFAEARKRYDVIMGSESGVPWVRKARALFTNPCTNRRGYTSLSHGLNRLLICARESLLLQPQQQLVFVLMYLRHFTTTRHLDVLCTMLLLCGKPDTGKSWAMQMLAKCVAQCLIVNEDSSSELSGTDGNHDSDLRIRITDEYRRTTGGGAEVRDSMSGTRDKNEQTRMSKGIIRHKRLVRNAAGKYSGQCTETVQRLLEYAGTNMPQDVTPAMQSRMTMIPVLTLNHTSVAASLRSGGVAASMTADERVAEDVEACKQALRLTSSLQVDITTMESFGGMPTLDTTCYLVFLCIAEKIMGSDAMPTRRKTELLRMAHAVKVWDDINAWHCQGLGDEFDNDPVAMLKFYAASQYLSMEAVVVAFTILEQSRSLDAFIEEIMMTLKSNIRVVNGNFEQTDHYYVSVFNRDKEMVRKVERCHPQLGDGICRKCLSVMRQGTTNKLPNIDVIKDSEGVERVVFHKQWLASVCTPVEDGLLLALKRMADARDPMVSYEYESEKTLVFDTRVRKTLVNPAAPDGVQFPELAGEPPEAIRLAAIMLENRCDADGNPLLDMGRMSIDTCKYVEAGHLGAEPSLVRKGRHKIRRMASAPVIVNPKIFDPPMAARSMTEEIVRTALIVAGGYDTGESRVFAGMDPYQPPDDLVDNCINIKPGSEVSITLPNMFYRATGFNSVLYGEDTGLELATCPDFFPSDKLSVTFTEKSHVEDIVRERALSQIALDPEFKEQLRAAHARRKS